MNDIGLSYSERHGRFTTRPCGTSYRDGMAERVGFEPTVAFYRRHAISSRAYSATLAPLRYGLPAHASERYSLQLMCWRRGWDSNPRWNCSHTGFRDQRLKPLGHLSEATRDYSIADALGSTYRSIASTSPSRSGANARIRVNPLYLHNLCDAGFGTQITNRSQLVRRDPLSKSSGDMRSDARSPVHHTRQQLNSIRAGAQCIPCVFSCGYPTAGVDHN